MTCDRSEKDAKYPSSGHSLCGESAPPWPASAMAEARNKGLINEEAFPRVNTPTHVMGLAMIFTKRPKKEMACGRQGHKGHESAWRKNRKKLSMQKAGVSLGVSIF